MKTKTLYAKTEKTEFLTPEEHQLVDKLGQCASEFSNNVLATGDTTGHDLMEFINHIHVLQGMVLSQAAARAYPERYRLLGSNFDGKTDE